MEMLGCIITLIILFVIYKLLDYVLRLPTVGQYSERYILVTGCDSGFGEAIARRLDGLGCHVFAGCLTEAGQLQLTSKCSERLQVLDLDVTKHYSVLWALDIVKSRLPSGKGDNAPSCILCDLMFLIKLERVYVDRQVRPTQVCPLYFKNVMRGLIS
jgi:NAD(P)-dependent dehydrogenase (short-subunit alcohol dehydrogenase family)